jgi:hypothetical protein
MSANEFHVFNSLIEGDAERIVESLCRFFKAYAMLLLIGLVLGVVPNVLRFKHEM